MAVTIISCYFLPFLFFFLAQIAFPKSITAFVLGISAISISCLILYLQLLDKIKPIEQVSQQPEPVAAVTTIQKAAEIPATEPKKISYRSEEPILRFAVHALQQPPQSFVADTKAIIAQLQQAILSQQNLFKEELQKRTTSLSDLQSALDRMQQALLTKETENTRMAKELEDLKFELYTLLRIESYATSTKEEQLTAASF